MTPPTATATTGQAVREEIAGSTVQAPSAPAAEPKSAAFDEIVDALKGMGFSERQIGRFFYLLERLKRGVEVSSSLSREVYVPLNQTDMRLAHPILEAVMPDDVLPAPGSLHEKISRFCLGSDRTLIHSTRDVNCSVEAHPALVASR